MPKSIDVVESSYLIPLGQACPTICRLQLVRPCLLACCLGPQCRTGFPYGDSFIKNPTLVRHCTNGKRMAWQGSRIGSIEYPADIQNVPTGGVAQCDYFFFTLVLGPTSKYNPGRLQPGPLSKSLSALRIPKTESHDIIYCLWKGNEQQVNLHAQLKYE